MTAPLFSIVVPIFNRAHTLRRCLASIFAQSFHDYEVIAVDDGSTDDSLARLRAMADERLRVLVHAANRGVCPARNTGIAAARGRWLVFLDSDDELAGPEALARMAGHARCAPDTLHALWFRSRLDDGSLSPEAIPACADLDYRGYLRFLEATIGRSRDMIRCVRSTCFERMLYPDSRMLEEKFHLDFALLFRSRLHEDVLRLYHQDAGNQLVGRLAHLHGTRDQPFLLDRANGLSALLEVHGRALERDAPRLCRAYRLRVARTSLRAGRHARAARQLVDACARAAVNPRTWLAASAACLLPGRERARTHA